MPIECKVKTTNDELLLCIVGQDEILLQDISTFKIFLMSYLKKPHIFKIFIDLRKINGAPMKCIKELVLFMTDCEDLAKNKVIATSVLVGKPSIEKLVNLLFNFKQPSTPTKVTADINEACDFLND